VDHHSEFGTFVSPRLTAFLRPAPPWTVRVSGGCGYFAPTPFTEETEATGLSRVAPLVGLEAERADSVSADVTWARAPFEITATLFYSRIDGTLSLEENGSADFPVAMVTHGKIRTRGTELIARHHREGFDVILTHMFLLRGLACRKLSSASTSRSGVSHALTLTTLSNCPESGNHNNWLIGLSCTAQSN
jgi:outer membrane receptor for ferrienterochelin and colicins